MESNPLKKVCTPKRREAETVKCEICGELHWKEKWLLEKKMRNGSWVLLMHGMVYDNLHHARKALVFYQTNPDFQDLELRIKKEAQNGITKRED